MQCLLLCAMTVVAQDYDQHFEDNTLRLDYIFAGNAQQQHIFVDEMMKQPRWAGRKMRMTETPLRGNGQLTMRDHDTHQLLYVAPFSTLFQEYVLTAEAETLPRAFECSYNVPFPKRPVDVTVELFDKYQRSIVQLTHTVDPADALIRHIGDTGIPYHYVWKGGLSADGKAKRDIKERNMHPQPFDPAEGVDVTGCVDIAIVAEGYTEQQMGKFYADCQRAVDALFEREPFKTLKPLFNVVAVAAPSPSAGPSVPQLGVWSDTPMRAHYNTFYMDRYLMTQDMHRIYDLLSGVPFEHIVVLVNTDTYGGGGIFNQVTVSSSNHPTFKQVLVHEFGHAYGGLADEYVDEGMHETWYPAEVEPWEPNITTLYDFQQKWADMLPEGTPIPTPLDPAVPNFKTADLSDPAIAARLNASTHVVGVFEGAGYQTKGCYRPVQECRMKINEVLDFCPVCSRDITRLTEFYTGR